MHTLAPLTDKEKELYIQLSTQVRAIVNTLLELRKPETAYETMKAIDSARQILHWTADAKGLLTIDK